MVGQLAVGFSSCERFPQLEQSIAIKTLAL
jgi:hypothetical protein